ncbi:hypothetical protein FLAG1_01068 [Fusarium langsethiae]|uniref:Uncharacterized protein n=1 Tax=Fusarium langsethiae TaxID=179993 RepID=A0A0N1J364_FUSLA|nr:hypothetical protein FLAG1_01068 [Fusarium langsethiae]GKT99595.1 unnamed protein product [Fusarium langsethiae]GKU16935.1 unnamed protein product [Fusarium langsethiae]
MAHQAERLPWQALASVFDLKPTNPCQHDAPNLHPRDEPETGQKLSQFLDAFFKAANLDAQREREKYPERYDPLDAGIFLRSMTGEEQQDEGVRRQYDRPSKKQVILADELVDKITPTVRRWYPKNKDGSISVKFEQGPQCPHINDSDKCECVLPFKERQLAAFQREYYPNDCWEFYQYNGEAYRNLEFVKTLILLGEMDPVLQVCSSDECHLARWWEAGPCYCEGMNLGWNVICDYAIKMYLTLNILYYFPETWQANDGSSIDDYRSLASYQMAIRLCTISEGCQIATYPHRDIFGIQDKQFSSHARPFDMSRWKQFLKLDDYTVSRMREMNPEWDIGPEFTKPSAYKLRFYPYGLMTYDEFLNFEKPVSYQPHSNDVSHVRWMLGQKGLPAELTDIILSRADYISGRSLPVDGKPFHPGNKVELDRYLEECWQLIVRCLMLGHELEDEDVDFEKRIRRLLKVCIQEIFRCDCEGAVELFYNFDGQF